MPAAVYELQAVTATQLLEPSVNVHKSPEDVTLPLQKVNFKGLVFTAPVKVYDVHAVAFLIHDAL